MKRSSIFSLIMISLGVSLNAQVDKNSELFLALKKQDSIFFERAFNRCDLKDLDTAVDKDLTFYHDRGGIQDRNKFLENVKNNLCSNPNQKPIRKVDAASLEVFPLYNNDVLYGVIQTGIHHFYIREPNTDDVHTGKARFTHLYLLQNNTWVLKEVLSYDHKE